MTPPSGLFRTAKARAMSAGCSACTRPATMSRGSPTSASTRSSTAARSRRGSPPARAVTSPPCARPGWSRRCSTRRSCGRSRATWRSATSATRPPAAARGRTRQPVWRDDGREVALAHNGNLTNAVELYNELRERGLGSAARRTRRSSPPAVGGGGTADRERGRGGDAPPRGRLLDRGDDEAGGGRLPRPARRAPASLGKLGDRYVSRLGELRLRHHRRRAAARGDARRADLAHRGRASRRVRSSPRTAPPIASSSTSTSRGRTPGSKAVCSSRCAAGWARSCGRSLRSTPTW